jgi:hypothetical protein
MSGLAIADLILSLIERLAPAFEQGLADAQQSGEATADEVQARRDRFAALKQSPEARTDDQTPVDEGGTLDTTGGGNAT